MAAIGAEKAAKAKTQTLQRSEIWVKGLVVQIGSEEGGNELLFEMVCRT
jgi:hypothetical protein